MRNRLSLVIVLLLSFLKPTHAQLVGTQGFLQGRYLEIGICANDAFGTTTSPTGYHPHLGFGGTNLAEVYDYGHDGWTVGTPAYMGDYTYPGSPFEGWEVQMNGTRSQQYASPAYSFTPYTYSGACTMTGGGLTSYSNVGGVIKAMWQGNFNSGGATLKIIQETRVDTLASAVVMTTRFYNTSAVAANNVYYWRSCDPDNDETWPGGGFPTDNVVDNQNATLPNPQHKVSVTAYGYSSTRPPLTLCTKDCRAVACIYGAWGLTVTQDLAALWNMTYGASYAVGVHDPGDIAIGLVYNLGTIAAGDSTAISYAYVFNGPSGIDSAGALPNPQLSINGSGPILSFPDTFNMCTLPTGVDTLPIDILYGSDKDWTWSHWTWTPATGLSATTGTHVILAGSFLSGPTTYTVTGTDSATGMHSCNTKTFVFTIKPCHFAYCNSPCMGDTIKLGMAGDSTGATYYWWGPDGFTSTKHSPSIFPAIWADTGMYYVVKTVAGTHDTDYCHLMIHPLPVVTLSSNLPTCAQITSPLNLMCNLDSLGEMFQWSGPFGFTSTMQNPSVTPFDSSLAGTYICTGTTVWGCKTTQAINIWPGITPKFTFVMHYGCNFDTVYFNDSTINADTYKWTFGDGTANVNTRNAMHIYNAHQKFVVRLDLNNPHCAASISDTVNLIHDVHAAFTLSPDTICLDGGATVYLNDGSYEDDSVFFNQSPYIYSWNYGDGATDAAVGTHPHLYTQAGAFPVKLVVTDSVGCLDSVTHIEYVVQMKISSFTDTTLCLGQPLPLTNVITVIPSELNGVARNYSWTQSLPNLDDPNVQIPKVSGIGNFTDELTVTMPSVVPDGCPVSQTVVIHSVLGAVLGNLTVSQTIAYNDHVQLNATGEVVYYWLPNDGSLDNNNINNPIASPTHTTTYTVFGLDHYGCLDSAYVTIFVDSTMFDGVPCAFSPNHDGLNDIFKPSGIQFQNMLEMRVYNRWGEELFYTNNKENGWDGTFHGVPQDIGTYYYMITVGNPAEGQNKVYKGTLTLIR